MPSRAEKLNHYAELLQSLGGALWLIRGVLLGCVLLHIVSAYQLWRIKAEARPEAYVRKATIATSYAARTMIWSGPIVGAFLVYHILHFTTGQALGSAFIKGDVYHNVIAGFSNPAAALFYIVANVLLAMHLYHGVWSMFQTLGLNNTKYTGMLRGLAILVAVIVTLGNLSFPIAVMAGIVGPAV